MSEVIGTPLAAPGEHSAPKAGEPSTSVPSGWDELWGRPSEDPARIEWHQLKKLSSQLARDVPFVRKVDTFASLVGSDGLRSHAVHRWFTYKEGFSPALLGTILNELEFRDEVRVADVFGGVATTALAGQLHGSVEEVRSVEYSPFACFVGQTKLSWPSLDPTRLKELLPKALAYDHHREVQIPELSAFSNPDIFTRARIRTLLAARDHLRELNVVDASEREFLLLGLAAVLEDLSGAMKDGRALRIRGDRSRRPSSLASAKDLTAVRGPIKSALGAQWSGMISDLRALEERREAALAVPVHHRRGDARHLDRVLLRDRRAGFSCGLGAAQSLLSALPELHRLHRALQDRALVSRVHRGSGGV
jgi:hypothetical protein